MSESRSCQSKRLIRLLAGAALLCLVSCTNTQIESYDPLTGKSIKFRTGANFNVLQSEVIEDQNRIGGFNDGGVNRDRLIETQAAPLPGQVPTLVLFGGDVEIYGTIDHATPIRETGNVMRGLAKSIVVGVISHKFIGETFDTLRYGMKEDIAKVAADRDVRLAEEANRSQEVILEAENALAIEELRAATP